MTNLGGTNMRRVIYDKLEGHMRRVIYDKLEGLMRRVIYDKLEGHETSYI